MKLYIYEHCPFCVRARMLAGIRNIALDETTLPYDDEATPIALIGAKQVPILQKPDGSHMGESLEIVRFLDEHVGSERLSERVRPELQAWLDKLDEYANRLMQPRFAKLPLAEYPTAESVAYYVAKKEKSLGSFATHLNKSKSYLTRLNGDLAELDALLLSEQYADGTAWSMEDILLFPLLRNLTVVRGAVFGTRTTAYLMNAEWHSGIDLYFDRAL